MEGIATIAYAGLKAYWRRKNYHRLGNAKEGQLVDSLGLSESRSLSQQPKEKNRRRFRVRRPRLKLGRFRFGLGSSVRKFLLKMRDAYVNAMLGVGISSAGYGGLEGGPAIAKEYDEKTLVEIYKRIVLAQQQQGQALMARKIGYKVEPVCLF